MKPAKVIRSQKFLTNKNTIIHEHVLDLHIYTPSKGASLVYISKSYVRRRWTIRYSCYNVRVRRRLG